MESGKLTASVSMESLDSLATGPAPAQVRTLFVSGLPMDAKPRELYLLFRAYAGYENSLLKMTSKNGKSTSPVGFVTFATRHEADEARKALQGVRFDPECAQTIRLELARSNTKVSRPKQSPPPAPSLPPHVAPFLPPPMPQPELVLDHMPLLNEHQLLSLSMPFTQFQLLPALQLQQMQHLLPHMQAAAAALPQAVTTAACSTLFVANLGQASEDEIRTVFKAFPGFTRLRTHAKGGSSVAFVEFSDVRQAAAAMGALQGFALPNSDRGGLRIEYARNKMADVNG